MRLTIRQMMTVVVFAAFACLGPTPFLQAYRLGAMSLPFVVVLGIPMGCLSCLVPAFALTRGAFRVWLVRLFLGLACLSFALTLACQLTYAFVGLILSGRPLAVSSEIWAFFWPTAGCVVLLGGLVYFLLRLIPRRCPDCDKRGMILISHRSTERGTKRLRSRNTSRGMIFVSDGSTWRATTVHWSCMRCGARFESIDRPVARDGVTAGSRVSS